MIGVLGGGGCKLYGRGLQAGGGGVRGSGVDFAGLRGVVCEVLFLGGGEGLGGEDARFRAGVQKGLGFNRLK